MATYSLYDHSTAPTLTAVDITDTPLTVGTLLKSNATGSITSVWIYVANTNAGGQAGSALMYQGDGWAAAPQPLLSQTDFTFQSTIGWQEIVLTSPVTATANQLYLVAVFINGSHYCATNSYFASADHTSGPLTAFRGDSAGGYDVGNGRFAYGSTAAYPQSRSSNYANYWVDLTLTVSAGGGGGGSSNSTLNLTTSSTTPQVGSGVSLTATPSDNATYTYAWTILYGSGSFTSTTSSTPTYTASSAGKHILKCVATSSGGTAIGLITLSAAAPTVTSTATFTASATDPLSAVGNKTSSLTLNRGGTPSVQTRSLYGHRLSFGDPVVNPSAVMAAVSDNPGTYVVRTYLQRDCRMVGMRFYKAPASHGDHIVALWQLGNTVPLITKTVSLVADDGGWIEVMFDAPIPLTASTTVPYLTGYFTPSGDVMRILEAYGSQEVIEYPFDIGVNSGAAGQVEGTGYNYGSSLGYPTNWIRHSYLIDPIVEWDSTDAVYTGGLDYYKRYDSYKNINHFPIGVWQPLPGSISSFASLGINTVVTYAAGDFNATKAAIIANNLDVFPDLTIGNYSSLGLLESDPAFFARIKGYIIRDEPDLIGPWTSPSDLQSLYIQIRQHDPTKMIILNLGKLVVINRGYNYLPSGATLNQANQYWRQFAKLTDIMSVDFYMEDSGNYEGIYGLWCNPRMVQRMQDLSENTRPMWHFVATTAPPGRVPSPDLVYKSVWAALIGGARGINFFDYQFTADNQYITDHAMATNTAMAAMVTALTARIQTLADALLAADADLKVSVDSSNKTAGPVGGTYGVPIHYTSRQSGGTSYLFTQSIRPGTTTASFTVPAAAGKSLTVIDENRSITVDGSGNFTDSFASDYAVHLYQWS